MTNVKQVCLWSLSFGIAFTPPFGRCGETGKTEAVGKAATTSTDTATYEVQRFIVPEVRKKDGFSENVYLVFNKTTKQGIIIDPGIRNKALETAIARLRIEVVAILNTHGHGDHIGANGLYSRKYKAEVYAHIKDKPFYRRSNGRPTRWIQKERSMKLGTMRVEVIHTPGHSPGSVCFRIGKHLFSGDTLFKDTIGQTPSNEASARLAELLKKILLALPVDTPVYPGHGDLTNIGTEKEENPYLQED